MREKKECREWYKIKMPLTVIKGNAEFLSERCISEYRERIPSIMQMSRNNCKRLQGNKANDNRV